MTNEHADHFAGRRTGELEAQLAEAQQLLKGRFVDVLGMIDVSCRELERRASKVVALSRKLLEKPHSEREIHNVAKALETQGNTLLYLIHTPSLTQYRQRNSQRQSVKQQGQQGERLGKARKALREADELLAAGEYVEAHAAIHRGLVAAHDRPSGSHRSTARSEP